MAALRKTTEVDGLSLVRAVRHAREIGVEPHPAAPAPPPERPQPPVEEARKARIGRTALPTKHEIFCYECGYTFQASGRVRALFCPKCRKQLDQADYTIETECREPVRTTGAIRLAPGGVLKAGALVARDVALAGRVEGGTVKAHRRLELEPGAEFDQDAVAAMDLRIAPGAAFKLKGRAMYRDVEVCGELNGHLAVNGVLTIRPGGHVKGRVHGAHLVVEEGGGLTARVEIEAAPTERAS